MGTLNLCLCTGSDRACPRHGLLLYSGPGRRMLGGPMAPQLPQSGVGMNLPESHPRILTTYRRPREREDPWLTTQVVRLRWHSTSAIPPIERKC